MKRIFLLVAVLYAISLRAHDPAALAEEYYSTWASLKIAEVYRDQGRATDRDVELLAAQLDQLRQSGFTRPEGAPYDSLKIVAEDLHGWFFNEEHLRHMIQTHHVKRVIEVGSWMGRSTVAIAEMLPPDGVVYAVDHFLGSTENQQGAYAHHSSLPFLYQQFLSNVVHHNVMHKVVPVRMSSLEAAKALQATADLVYLDGAHDTVNVYADLIAWYPFVEHGGIMCGDDESWPSVMAAVTRFAVERRLLVERRHNIWILRKPNQPPRLK